MTHENSGFLLCTWDHGAFGQGNRAGTSRTGWNELENTLGITNLRHGGSGYVDVGSHEFKGFTLSHKAFTLRSPTRMESLLLN